MVKRLTGRFRKKKSKKRKKNRYAEQGRFIGYFHRSKRGSTFSEGRTYCHRKYGGLASIGTKHENEQIQRICNVILGDNRSNGFYCWLGLKKPWKKWMDNRKVSYLRWSPTQRHIHKGQYKGNLQCVAMYKKTGYWYHQRCGYRNGVICEKPHGKYVGDYIVIQKEYRYSTAKKMCQEWYGTELASIHSDDHNRNVRRACMTVSGKGHCWIGLREPFEEWEDGLKAVYKNWKPGEPNNRGSESCTEIYPSGKWNNIPCRVHRYPICNGKPLIDRMDNSMRWKLIRNQYRDFRKQWARNQQLRWLEKMKKKKSWDYRFRKMMMQKLKIRTKQRYKDDLRTKFFNAQFNLHGKDKMHYRPLLSKEMLNAMYYQKYGRFPKVQTPKWMKQYMNMLRNKGKGRQRPPDYQIKSMKWHKHTYGDLDHKPFRGNGRRMSTRALKGLLKNQHYSMKMRMRRRLIIENGDRDRKCVLLGNIDGLKEVCVDREYIEIKEYVKRVVKNEVIVDVVEYGNDLISNSSEVNVDYIDYENWKYKKSAYIEENKMIDMYQSESVGYKYNVIGNVEDDVYYAKRYEFMPRLIMGKECWSIMDDLVILCLSVDHHNDDDDMIGFEILKENISSGILLYKFSDDKKWDEVNVYIDDGLIEKCTHLYEMKICVQVENDKQSQQFDIIQLNVLTLHDDDNDNENEEDEEIFF